ncbi:MAG TPA: asparagine synthase (glutamine-hydrolyzing) [Trueperaceae bacterium]|nr:asparagine synthase (glutamine-hydrolyzing) [Trueperaceae bacterium]
MGGICGAFDPRHIGDGDDALSRMLTALVHRGPDNEGRFVAGPIALGARGRGGVTAAGWQPFVSEDGRYVLVYDGEVLDHAGLRSWLEARGHRFRSDQAAEVVVHLFEEVGPACVDRLRGAFAFAVWDRHENELVLVRDRLGEKPLYYADTGSGLVFGSEIKAVVAHPSLEPRIDLVALSDFLTLRYVPAPRTMFEGIKALEPGYWLKASTTGVSTAQYWDVDFAPSAQGREVSESAALEELRARLEDSVAARLMVDVPIGAFLSGGLDSSSLVAFMARRLPGPVPTFSVGFGGLDAHLSELPYARAVAARYRTDHCEEIVDHRYFLDNIDRIVWHLDQPIGDYAQFAYDAVARRASGSVNCVFSGEGGDELFAGYGRHFAERLATYSRLLPAALRRILLSRSDVLVRSRRHRTAMLAILQSTEAERLANWIPLVNPLQKERLLAADVRIAVGRHTTAAVVARHLERTPATDPLQRLLYLDTKLWLPDYLLARSDKLTMAWSLETRAPLLDHELVEFAAGLPARLKLKGRTRKYLLRRATAPLLPPEVLDRSKQGFANPFPRWLRTELRAFVRDLLAPESVRSRGLFDPGFVNGLLDEHETGRADHSTAIYGLLSVELWYRAFIAGGTARRATHGEPVRQAGR